MPNEEMKNENERINEFNRVREENSEDNEFKNGRKIEFFEKDDITSFYDEIKNQLKILFRISIALCVLATILIFVGIYIALFAKNISTGAVISIIGGLSEFLNAVFIKQYQTTLSKNISEYGKLASYKNLFTALEFAKKLPLTTMADTELRYLEVRELLRAVRDNFLKL